MIDSHCHLSVDAFDADRGDVITRARAAGVTGFITIGAGDGLEGNTKAVALAQQHTDMFAAVGLHPHDADQFNDTTIARLQALAQQPRVVAIGEIGLDYHYDLATKANQRAALEAQLALAGTCNLPYIIHNRDAATDLLPILRQWSPPHPGVIHCFTGDAATARQFLDLGLYLSIPGVVTFKNAEAVREAIITIPLDRLLIETDAPYLAPMPHRGKRNEPAYMVATAERIATILGKSAADIGEVTAHNTRVFFRLPPL